MLSSTIQKYIRLFKNALNVKNSSRIADEMKKEFEISPPLVSEVIEEFRKYALTSHYSGASILLSAAWSNLSKDYTPILCQILNDEIRNGLHEPIVEILDELRDERAIPALSKALTYRWPDDEWLNVPKKSLLALAEIGTPEAIMIIQEATKSPEELIRDYANMILESFD